jgi:hypothetical protein
MKEEFVSITIRAALTAILVTGFLAACAKADDVADIKASGRAFVTAMHEGDIAEAKKHALTDEGSEKLLEVMVTMTKSRAVITDAAVAKFGDEGKTIVAQGQTPGQLPRNYEDADIQVMGDTATVTPKSGRPVKFKKDGDWKVDFTALPNKEQLDKAVPMMTAMSSAMTETAAEIKDNKYSTLAQAKQAFHMKMAASLGIGGAPGAPGGRPQAPPPEK